MEKIDMTAVILFTILPIMLTFSSIQSFWQIRLLKRYKGRVNAKVVGIREHIYFDRIFKKVTVYFFTFQYCIDDVTYVLELKWGVTDNVRYPLGSEVELSYDEKNHTNFLVSGEEKHWKKEAIQIMIWAGASWLFIICALIHDIFFS